MARTRTQKPTTPQPRPMLARSRDAIAAQVAEQQRKGRELLDRAIETPEGLHIALQASYTWRDYTKELLRGAFSTDEISEEFGASVRYMWSGGPTSLAEDVHEFRTDQGAYLRRLDSIAERLPLFDEPVQLGRTAARPQTGTGSAFPDAAHRVFIVHGRDRGPVEACARLLRDQDLKPVILDEQLNGGRTIIEKFEAHADVAFAVVVMTPDDAGGLAGTELSPRARQNVVLELGFFIGLLGRRNVAALVSPGVEIPSDIDGVLYIPLDTEGLWRLRLAKELRGAGLDVDLNRL